MVANLPSTIAPARLETYDSLGIVVGYEASEHLRAGFGFQRGGMEDVLNPDQYAMEHATQMPLARLAVKLSGCAARSCGSIATHAWSGPSSRAMRARAASTKSIGESLHSRTSHPACVSVSA